MARRGFGGMTALRAALGAAVGVGEGLQQREVLAAQRKKEEEEAIYRRLALGLMPVEEQPEAEMPVPSLSPSQQMTVGPLAGLPRPTEQPEAATPLQTIMSRSASAPVRQPLSVAAPSFASAMGQEAAGGMPSLPAAQAPQTPAMSAVQRVLQEFRNRPRRTVEIGGQRYSMPSTGEDNMALNMALQQAASEDKSRAESAQLEEQARFLASMPQFGGNIQKARAALRGVSPGFLGIETKSPLEIQQAQVAMARDLAQIADLKSGRGGGGGGGGGGATGTGAATPGGLDFAADLRAIQDFLPTVGQDGKIVPPRRKLDARKALAVQQGGPGGTFIGQLANLAATTFGADMTNEQLYNTVAEGIGTAYAIQEQRGRNVSDKDVANRVAQVKVLPSEIGSLEVQRLKAQRIQQMASLLMSGKVPQVEAGQTATPPTFSPQTPQSPQGAGKRTLEQEFPGREAQIRTARAQGYSDADIRAFLSRSR